MARNRLLLIDPPENMVDESGSVAKHIWLPPFVAKKHAIELGDGTGYIPPRYKNMRPPYPNIPLQDGEVIVVTKPFWLSVVPMVVLYLALGFGIAAYLLTKATWDNNLPYHLAVWLPPVLVVLSIALSYRRYVKWWCNVFYITARSISKRKRWLFVADKSWVPNDVGEVDGDITRPRLVFGWFDIGNITVYRQGGESVLISIRRTGEWMVVRDALKYINRAPDEAAHESAAALDQLVEMMRQQQFLSGGGYPSGQAAEVSPQLQHMIELMNSYMRFWGARNSSRRLTWQEVVSYFGVDTAYELQRLGVLPTFNLSDETEVVGTEFGPESPPGEQPPTATPPPPHRPHPHPPRADEQ